MKCQTIYEKLPLLDDAELSPAERGEVELHIAACAHCAREVDLIRATQQELWGLRHAQPPAHGPARIVQATRMSERPRVSLHNQVLRILRGHPLPFGSLLAGAVAVVLFVVLPSLQPRQTMFSSVDAPPEIATTFTMEAEFVPMRMFSAQAWDVADHNVTINVEVRDPHGARAWLIESLDAATLPWAIEAESVADGSVIVFVSYASNDWISEVLQRFEDEGAHFVQNDLGSDLATGLGLPAEATAVWLHIGPLTD